MVGRTGAARRRRSLAQAGACLLVLLLLRGSAAAAPPLPDVTLRDQDGRPVRLYTDLFADRVVVAQAFFTSCSSTCPKVTRKLMAVQRRLGDRFGREVFMVSLSVDPTVDTPQRLKRYASRFHSRPGWTLVTGSPEDMEAALGELGFFSAQRESHTTMVLVADERHGTWRKADGLGPPDEVVRVVEEVLAAR